MNESGSCVGVGVKYKDFVLSTELTRYIGRQMRKKIEKLRFQVLRPVIKILENLYIWFKWPAHHLVLVIPPHPLSKLLAIQDHVQNLEEQL